MTSPVVLPEPKAISFRNILLATDFSHASEKAFSYAVAIARQFGSKILLVHVIPPESVSFIPEISGEHQRNETVRQLQSLSNRSELNQIPHETVMRSGTVWSALSAVIGQQDIDLLVLGTHGRSGVKKLVLGSVAEEVLRKAGCPVITVGPQVDTALSTTGGYQRILFASDFHPASAKALDYAALLANQFQAHLILLHVLPPAGLPGPEMTFYNESAINEWQAKVIANAKAKLKKLLRPELKLWSEPEYVVGFDFTTQGILKTAADRKVDLIVVGANRLMSAKVSAHVPGTVSYGVIRQANCPVLTVSA